MKNSNKNRFNIINKSDVLPPDFPNNPNDINYSINPRTNYEEISTYTAFNGRIVEEYCFDTSDCTLYRDNDDNTLSPLYSSVNDADGECISIYKPNGVYIAMKKDNGFDSILYIDAKDFQTISNTLDFKVSIPILKQIYHKFLEQYTTSHSLSIVSSRKIENSENNSSFYEEFKKLFIRYSSASQYIPAHSIINDILGMLNRYIATGILDKSFLIEYMHLFNFHELCYDSIEETTLFVTDSSHTDLRKLSDSLQKNANNISKLLNLYLKEKIER